MYLGMLSEFVPNVCQLMLNTGTPCVDTGADLQYMSDEPKMSLPCPHTYIRIYIHTNTHRNTHTDTLTHSHHLTQILNQRIDLEVVGDLNPGALCLVHTTPPLSQNQS